MDEQTIRQNLTTLAKEEVPDVNLLPNIQEQLDNQPRTRPSMVFQMARAAAVLVMVMMASVAGYALVLQGNLVPSDIPQDLISEINQEQTIEGMTAELNWAYADAHRMALEVTTSYDASQTHQGNQEMITLTTADGVEIPAAFGGGGGGTAGGSNDTLIMENSFMSSFDARGLDFDGDTLDLVLILSYGYAEAPAMGSGGGGGGGQPPATSGGGGGGGQAPAQNAEAVPDDAASDRTFVFEFSVPFLPAREGTAITETQVLGDESVTISNVRVTPSMTVFDVCSELIADGWMPRVYLQSDQPVADYIENPMIDMLPDGREVYAGLSMMPPEDGTDCREVTIAAPFTADGEQLMLIVDGFFKMTPEDTEEDVIADVNYFEAQGFDLSYEIVEPPVMGGERNQAVIPMSMSEMLIVTINAHPEAMTIDQARSYIGGRMLTDRIDGSLTFEIAVE